MSYRIEEFEDAIAAYLQAAFPAISVAAFPDRPEEYRFTHPIGTILVQYRGSEFGATQDVQSAIFYRTLSWDITLYIKSLRSHRSGEVSALGLLDDLRATLTGWRPQGAVSAMTPQTEEFLSRDASGPAGASRWIYVARYSLVAPLVQQRTSPATAPLRRITGLSEEGRKIRDVQKETSHG